MIEREFVAQKLKEYQIQEFMKSNLKGAGHSYTKVQRTPLGEKIVVFASKPGLVVGRKGANIKKLTSALKKKFKLENPQIELNEVANIDLDASIVAERIANTLERFGAARFKGVGHKTMQYVMGAGAKGIEIIISGKIPSSRAKNWRFYQGYLKKCGDTALEGVDYAEEKALLKTGTIGIKVRIMPPDTVVPDTVEFATKGEIEETTEEKPPKEKKPKEEKK